MALEQLLPNYVGDVQNAYDQGRQRAAQKGLASLASGYYAQQGNDTLAQMAQFDPGAAVQFQKVQQDDQAQQKAQLGELAGYLLSVPEEQRPQVWQSQVAPLVGKLIPGAEREPYGPHVADIAQWAVNEYGKGANGGLPAGVQEYQYMSRGLSPEDDLKARRVALGLEARPSSGLPYQVYKYTNGEGQEVAEVVDKRSGASAAPNSAPAVSPMQMAALLSKFGGTMTSGYRSPDKNKQVGGVSNSQHMQGTGQDWVFPPQVKAQAKAFAQAQGYEVIDEGDHLHFELPGHGPNPYASRPAEQQAAMNSRATEEAKIDAQISNTDRVAASEAQVAAEKARATARATAQGEREAGSDSRVYNATRTLDLLNDAEDLLGQSTGSGLGVARDSALAIAGQSTEGAQAAAALGPIASQLIMMVPRMEGPQSDRDTQLYKQAAGDLANPAIPVGTRMAALRTMRQLNEKYAGVNAKPTTSAPSTLTPAEQAELAQLRARFGRK